MADRGAARDIRGMTTWSARRVACITVRDRGAHRPGISSQFSGVSHVALRTFELRRGRVILSGVHNAPEAMPHTGPASILLSLT